MRHAMSALLLLGLAGCASGDDARAATVAPPAASSPTRGDPLPEDCKGELRPVTSGVAAACIARRAIPPGARPPSGGDWHYSVTFRDAHWVVSIHDPSPSLRGAYLIHVDPKTGRILKVQPQK